MHPVTKRSSLPTQAKALQRLSIMTSAIQGMQQHRPSVLVIPGLRHDPDLSAAKRQQKKQYNEDYDEHVGAYGNANEGENLGDFNIKTPVKARHMLLRLREKKYRKESNADSQAISEEEMEEDGSQSEEFRMKKGPIIMKHIDVEKFLSPAELHDTEIKIGVFYDKERKLKRFADGMHLIKRFVNPLSQNHRARQLSPEQRQKLESIVKGSYLDQFMVQQQQDKVLTQDQYFDEGDSQLQSEASFNPGLTMTLMSSPKHQKNHTTRHRDQNKINFENGGQRRQSVDKTIEPFRLSATQQKWKKEERESIETTWGGKTLQKDSTQIKQLIMNRKQIFTNPVSTPEGGETILPEVNKAAPSSPIPKGIYRPVQIRITSLIRESGQSEQRLRAQSTIRGVINSPFSIEELKLKHEKDTDYRVRIVAPFIDNHLKRLKNGGSSSPFNESFLNHHTLSKTNISPGKAHQLQRWGEFSQNTITYSNFAINTSTLKLAKFSSAMKEENVLSNAYISGRIGQAPSVRAQEMLSNIDPSYQPVLNLRKFNHSSFY
ncbi:hypothetical protein FGO68_gene5786 [Halteria grandinella]|uniref:Uncharacterized protein n=1 Tax=Halteria grandinella TaxID=5974 RepID=A0A8J8NSB5_HALGN|nr:hypothetical protein FGO68_gene5786 [Halteria grandinella]